MSKKLQKPHMKTCQEAKIIELRFSNEPSLGYIYDREIVRHLAKLPEQNRKGLSNHQNIGKPVYDPCCPVQEGWLGDSELRPMCVRVRVSMGMGVGMRESPCMRVYVHGHV